MIIQNLCGRVENLPNEIRTHGLTAGEIMENQSTVQLMTIYSPCINDIQFFDGWGG